MVLAVYFCKFIHLSSSIKSAKYQAWQTSLILFPLRLLPSNNGHDDRRNTCEGYISDLFSDGTRLK